MIKTHAELERDHYHEVRTNPLYRLSGEADLLREELSLSASYPNMPRLEVPPVIIHQHVSTQDSRVFASQLKRITILEEEVLKLKAGRKPRGKYA